MVHSPNKQAHNFSKARAFQELSGATKAPGGGGYTHAAKVAAAFLVQMLQRVFSVEPEFSAPAGIHFEAAIREVPR